MSVLLDSALGYASRNWPVFPLKPREKTPMSGSHGFKDATTNPNMVERYWDRWPDANIGLATGAAAKVWVLDIDGPEGEASLRKLEEELGPLPDTLGQQTGGGGRQLFFAWPEGREIRNRSNLRPGIDVRAEGGYVVVPPSIHPSGKAYMWTVDDKQPIVHASKEWLDFVCPPPAPPSAPWDKPSPSAPLFEGGRLPVIERARLYLREVDPAIQGAGGHNAALWAARCLVVGFLLPDATAIELLWSDYNPRCTPPWNRQSEADRRDLERKVGQAKDTPPGKRPGWLLDEFGLRGADAHARLMGETSAAALLASAKRRAAEPETPLPEAKLELPRPDDRQPFPVEFLPEAVRDYCVQLAASHVVDTSFLALPALCVAGAAMGNAWRLEVKPGEWEANPILWVAIIADPGRNKTGPLRSVKKVLEDRPPPDMIPEPMLNPQGNMVVGNATVEAIVSVLSENRRGVLSFNDELSSWIESQGQYKKGKGGADEAAWLQFWNGDSYRVNRKTNNEQTVVPAASVCVLGGIQPKVLARLFDPTRFDSGFVSRVLLTYPPFKPRYWSNFVVGQNVRERWHEVISWLRCTPFVAIDTNTGVMRPRVVPLTGEASTAFADFYDALEYEQEHGNLESDAKAFVAKAQGNGARFALIHHGLRLACGDRKNLDAPISVESIRAGAAWARWCLTEQLRVYGFNTEKVRLRITEELLVTIQQKSPTKSATTRQVMRWHRHRFDTKEKAVAAMGQLVELGYAHWEDATRDKVILNEGAKT